MTRAAFAAAFACVGSATLLTMVATPVGAILSERAASRMSQISFFRSAPQAALPPNAADLADAAGRGAFVTCLSKSGPNPEQSLRDLLAYRDHAATLGLVECLLDAPPQSYCPPNGGGRAADAMELYLWARDDAKITSPAHGLADRIRINARVGEGGESSAPDPFALSWSGPRDRALFEKLRSLAKQGYLHPGAFAYSARAELREALAGVKPEAAPCDAGGGN